MKCHSFNTELAAEVGLEHALILTHISFWVEKNELNQSNLVDGEFWTYNTYDAFVEQFPYMKLNTIKRVIRELKEDGHIGIRNDISTNPYDRTNWYSIPKTSIVRKMTLDRQKSDNVHSQKNNYVNKSYTKADTIKNNKKISAYDIFLSDLKKLCPIKSKITKTKDGAELFKNIKNVDLLISDYLSHQKDKKEFAKRITAFMEDYESYHKNNSSSKKDEWSMY
jgi:hypothetical protein